MPPKHNPSHDLPHDQRTTTSQAYQTLLRGDTVITSRVETASTMLKRMRGLLGRPAIASDEGLWITPCTSIHMFFMRFPIDVIFVDRSLRIIRIHHDVQPWKMARGGRGTHSVFELAPGTAAAHGLQTGDQLILTSS